MNVEIGTETRYSFSGNIVSKFRYFVFAVHYISFFIFLIKYNGYMRGFVNISHNCRGSGASVQDSEKG